MKRIKQLIADHKKCWHLRKESRIKWSIEALYRDMPASQFFFIPTIVYRTYPYRCPGTFVFEILFLHWYIGIGEWGYEEDE